MKGLLKAFKSLPPEMKMMIAMAGLGSPIGIVYFIRRFPGLKNIPTALLILIGAGIIGLICLVSLLFKRGSKRQGKKLASELASGTEAGPQSMGLRASIKENNDKFFNAINDMRKRHGISVYDQPWYILIGDSGCGKTKLVNESGLTFSQGKPEGYQLGTLNYNWWFTEEAVFIDMAGRLCNPQEDADRREWEAFLGTVGRGRSRCPINGVIACVSAEHLLQDSPEKQEEDANTMLERLRDLQNRLGVTFATYVAVTKCDKILGFMQFFDRAEQDIRVKNQIYGWSRPGQFNAPYDPDDFEKNFDGVYQRLHDLRLRRLNDEAEGIELGLAYSYPEAFRELLQPLQIYVRTLFPLIKNPRAVKTLIFRGVYFTSATQQGSVILKQLAERLGAEAAETFAPLESLYPRPRPLFVKDLLVQKVLPEHGLVFRSEKHLIRSKRMHRLLAVGSTALIVLLATMFFFSWRSVAKTIGDPKEDANKAVVMLEPDHPVNDDRAREMLGKLIEGSKRLRAMGFSARAMSGFISSAAEPAGYLEYIQTLYFERLVVGSALGRVRDALAGGGTETQRLTEGFADRFRTSLLEYVAWYLARDADEHDWDFDRFKRLCQVLPEEQRDGILTDETSEQFDAFRRAAPDRNLARVLQGTDEKSLAAIEAGLDHLRGFWEPLATVDEKNPDEIIRAWMSIDAAAKALDDAYDKVLSFDTAKVSSVDDQKAFTTAFSAALSAFNEALSQVHAWPEKKPVTRLADAVAEVRLQNWVKFEEDLTALFESATSRADTDRIQAALVRLREMGVDDEGNRGRGLDELCWQSLQRARLALENTAFQDLENRLQKLDVCMREVADADSWVITTSWFDKEKADRGAIVLNADGEIVRTALANISGFLQDNQESSPAADAPLAEWLTWIDAHLEALEQEEEAHAEVQLPADARWRPPDLARLNDGCRRLMSRGGLTFGIRTLRDSLEDSLENGWGIAQRFPGAFEEERSPYSIRGPVSRQPTRFRRDTAEEEDTTSRRKARRSVRERGRSRGRSRRKTEDEQPARAPTRRSRGRSTIPRCCTRSFLTEATWDSGDLREALRDVDGTVVLDDRYPRECIEFLEQLEGEYYERYFDEWLRAYEQSKPRALELVVQSRPTWTNMAKRLGSRSGPSERVEEIRDEVQEALAGVLQHVVWAEFELSEDWDSERGRIEDARDVTWTDYDFVYGVRNEVRGDPDQPWVVVAEQVADAWMAFAEDVYNAHNIPRNFGRETVDEDAVPAIKWKVLEALRKDTGLSDEKFVAGLLGYASRMQELLDDELHSRLYRIQEKALGGSSVAKGLPYLSGGRALPLQEFRGFLIEVDAARRVLKQVDQSDLKRHRARRVFYESCAGWRELVAGVEMTPLKVDVRYQTTPEATDADGVQNFYDEVGLGLGLTFKEAKKELAFASRNDPSRSSILRRECEWDWVEPPSNLGPGRIRLIGPLAPELRGAEAPAKKLGHLDALALPRVLESYGREVSSDRREWLLEAKWDLKEEFPPSSRADRYIDGIPKDWTADVIASFRISLDQALPVPVVLLTSGETEKTGE